jgi:hypothetical protein
MKISGTFWDSIEQKRVKLWVREGVKLRVRVSSETPGERRREAEGEKIVKL